MTGTEEMTQSVRAYHRVSRRNLNAQAQALAEPTPPGLTRRTHARSATDCDLEGELLKDALTPTRLLVRKTVADRQGPQREGYG